MNSTAQQVYYCNMADNVQWGSCAYPLYPITSPYIYPSTPLMMMAPQPQGHIYYIPNAQYCSPYNQHMQQYQYSNYGYYAQYQPSVVPGTMNHVQQHQAPLAQATPALPKRAGKKITIRDPNQGGRDITQEILSGSDPETRSVQDLQSVPVPVEAEDPAPASSLPGSVDVPVAEEEKICTDLEDVAQKLPSNDLGSVTDHTLNEVPIESASISSVELESVALQNVSPCPPPEIPALPALSGSVDVPVESGKLWSDLMEENDAEISALVNVGSDSNSTGNEVPSENVSVATGKCDDVVMPVLVPSEKSVSDSEELLERRRAEKEKRVKSLIDITVERATSEPNSAAMYATFCYQLEDMDVPTYKKLVLSRCQEELKNERKNDMARAKKQKELNEASKEKVQQCLRKDLEEEKIKTFQSSLPNMEFIAELYKLKMLPRLFINSWIEQKLVVNPSEENLECLCRLMSIIGKDLHEEKDQYLLDLYFSAINKIIQQRKTSSRICCMLQGIMDLRQNNWVPKSDNQGTKTINEVHKVSEKEKPQEKEKQQVPSNKCCRGRIIKQQDDGLMTVTIRNGTINTPHPSKINKPGAPTYNQLDGCGRTCSWGNWSKGGSRGSTDRTSAKENTSAHIRRSYRKNEHCDRDQNKHWERRDRRYRGQDMRPHY